MSEVEELRQQRVFAGSRRKRDLQAIEGERPDWTSYRAEHFPDPPGLRFDPRLTRAITALYMGQSKPRKLPDPEAVRAYLRERGEL